MKPIGKNLKVLMIATAWLLAILTGSAVSAAEEGLHAKLMPHVEKFHGDAGIYVRHLRSGEEVAVNADSLFPTASMIKIPILVALFDRIEKGELAYNAEFPWSPDSVNYPYDGDILWSYESGREISVDKLATLMITYSDNHASLWLQSMAGSGVAINQWLHANGFQDTRMNSRTPGRNDAWKKYGWGQTTPREMAELMVMIRTGKAVSPAASEEMYRLLGNIYWNNVALSMIPPTVQAASKQGAVNQSRSEVVLVNAPGGDYVFCVITKNQQDSSWEVDNEGWQLIRNVSQTLWQHFEPGHPWAPAAGGKKYRP